MENNRNRLILDVDKSLEEWVDHVFMPVVSAIGYITLALEGLFDEIN